MAIQLIPSQSTLKIKVQTGVNGSGNPTYAYRSYSNVKHGAAAADIHAVGQSLSALQRHPVVELQRVDTGNLVNM